MKTSALPAAVTPVLSLVPEKNNNIPAARILYGISGYSKIKEIFSIKPVSPVINILENFIHESELNDPGWFSSYE
jgi:hypothetical protein